MPAILRNIAEARKKMERIREERLILVKMSPVGNT
jgi:hypothetical protein